MEGTINTKCVTCLFIYDAKLLYYCANTLPEADSFAQIKEKSTDDLIRYSLLTVFFYFFKGT